MLHQICGLSVVADGVPLPGLWQSNIDHHVEVAVNIGRVPVLLEGAEYIGSTWSVRGQDFLLCLPGLMRMLVRAGHEIIVEPAAGVELAETAPFVLSTGFAAILHQRHILALHAATIVWQGGAVAICGPTGAGKSTLAAALCAEGAAFLGDDIATIRPDGSGRPMVCPDGRQHRLWADAVAYLGLTDRQGLPVRSELNKFHVAPDREIDASLPLSTIVLLEERSAACQPSPPEIIDVPIVDALPLLRRQVYRPSLAERMGHEGRLFTQIAGILGHVRVLRLERTRDLVDLKAGAELLLSRIARPQ